jgi:Holliday junction resolvase RusA-like endonuclease
MTDRKEVDNMIEFKIDQKCPPMPRPRVVRKGGKAWIYSPKPPAIQTFQRKVLEQIDEDFKTIAGPVDLNVFLYQKATQIVIRKPECKVPGNHGDIDNVLKTVMDSLQPRIVLNDKQVDEAYIKRMCSQSYPEDE